MKIIPGKYIEEHDWQKWIKFRYAHGSRLSMVFLWRVAALARDLGMVLQDVLGYRPIEESKRLYEADLKANGGKPSGEVQEPGYSWHEFGLALDITKEKNAAWKTHSLKNWVPLTRLKQPLNKYGLILPLNNVDSKVIEWWHLQPIETAYGIAKENRKNFLDPDDAIWGDGEIVLTEFQTAAKHINVYKGEVDNKAGKQTKAAAEEFLKITLQILGLQDPRELQAENTQLKNDKKLIEDIVKNW